VIGALICLAIVIAVMAVAILLLRRRYGVWKRRKDRRYDLREAEWDKIKR
jgi:hypothetical protein